MSRNAGDTSTEGTVDLRELLVQIMRRKWLVLGVTVVVTALVGVYSYTRTPSYTSRADLHVRPILTNPLESYQTDRINLQTEIRIATSAAVGAIVLERLDSGTDIEMLLDNVSVAAPDEAQILEISYSDRSPEGARRVAQAFADAYLEFKSDQAVESIARQTAALQGEIDELNELISQVNAEISTLGRGSSEWEDAVDRRNAFETTRLALQGQLATLSTLSVDPGQVIQPAPLPGSPSSPKHRLDLMLGLLIGLIAGVVTASASERFHDRIDGHAVLEQILEAPVLGVIPKASFGRGRWTRPVTVEQPRSIASEAFRTLRTNLLAVSARPQVKTILVTSAWMGEGKSTVAANVSAALAQLGRDVVLISADLRYPRVHTYFGLANEQGLGQVLKGEVPFREALCDSSVPKLRVLPSGPVMGIEDPVELMQSERMEQVIAESRSADFVVIDGAPVIAVADSLVLATMVDAVLFVADRRAGRRDMIAQSRDQLRQVGARVIGGVLNRVDGWRANAGGYGAYDYRRGLLYRVLVSDSSRNRRSNPASSDLRK